MERKSYKHQWYLRNKKRLAIEAKKRYRKQRTAILAGRIKYASEHRDQIKAYKRQYYLLHKEQLAKKHQVWYAKNAVSQSDKQRLDYQQRKPVYQARARQQYLKHRPVYLNRVRKYQMSNRDKINRRLHSYFRQKRKIDATWRLNRNMGTAIWFALKKDKQCRSWSTLVPYSLAALRQHLEKLFQPGMTWENYGKDGWEVDHIKPRCAFSYCTASDPQFAECWALGNLQPLWKEDNLIKSVEDKKQAV